MAVFSLVKAGIFGSFSIFARMCYIVLEIKSASGVLHAEYAFP
jgi:hypothetical protein